MDSNKRPSSSRFFASLLTLYVPVLAAISWCSVEVHAFNVDTQFPIVYSMKAESYFGYTTGLLINGQGNWLLVGAPRANRTNPEANLVEPGVLFKCKIPKNSADDQTCTEVELDVGGNVEGRYRDQRDINYWPKYDNGWLGVSLDIKHADGLVVCCGHRWKNQYHYRISSSLTKLYDYYSNGICYAIDRDLRTDRVQKLIPLIKTDKQANKYGMAYHAFGMAGISAHIFGGYQKPRLLLGAPGLHNWQGGSVSYQSIIQEGKVDEFLPVTFHEPSPSYAYAGYAVSSLDQFIKNEPVTYLIGAPRHKYVGKIYVIYPSSNGEIQSIKFEQEGYQLGEYFGAALCATDLNGDQLSDMIIGAPFHSKLREEGKVYVYLNNDEVRFKNKVELHGSSIPKARFGSAITCLDDLNADDLNDFAVGAPYENEHGAVYIYYGNTGEEFVPKYVQRIEGKSFTESFSGFGISIGKNVDIDRNNFRDIAIGSYSSGKAVVLRTSPVVQLIGKVTLQPQKIRADSNNCFFQGTPIRCFNVTTCIHYESPRDSFGNLEVKTKLSIDAEQKIELPRGFIDGENGKSFIEKNFIINKKKCVDYTIYLRDKIQQYIPVPVVFEYDLQQSDRLEFCPRCPVLDILSPKSERKTAFFLSGCGTNVCLSNLQLDAKIVYDGISLDQPEVWIGLNKTLTIIADIRNTGEQAYLSELNITMPSWSSFVKPPPRCIDYSSTKDHRYFICDIGNPLLRNESTSLELKFDIKGIPVSKTQFDILMEAMTGSNDINPKDNFKRWTIPAKLLADIEVTGIPSTEHINYHPEHPKGTGIEFVHTYNVRNLGPSPLPIVTVELKIPIQTNDQKVNFLNLTKLKTTDGSRSATVIACRGTAAWHYSRDGKSDQLEIPEQVRKKRNTKNADMVLKSSDLHCETTECQVVECDIRQMVPDESVKLELNLELYPDKLREMKIEVDAVSFVTEAFAKIDGTQPYVQPPNHAPDFDKIKTTFDTGRPAKSKLPDWVIPVSIISGVLLLAIIFAIFYKVGFFKRSQRDELNKMKRQSQMGPPPTDTETKYDSQNELIKSEEPPTDGNK